MKLTPLRALAVLTTFVAVAVAGAATADAGKRHGKRAVVVKAAAAYVGVTPRALVGELRSRKSLAQVAVAHGKSVDGLKQAVLAAFDARLSRAVAAGRITPERKAQVLARVESRLERFVNRVWDGAARGGAASEARKREGKRAIVLNAAATFVGVKPRVLIGELRTGKSLAQVAVAHGKSVDGVKRAVLAAFDARLSRAVAAGRITPERKAEVLARVESRLERFVNRVWRAR